MSAYLTVLGSGSFGAGYRTFRGGPHEIDGEIETEVRDWLEKHPAAARWLVVTTEPHVVHRDARKTGPLELADLVPPFLPPASIEDPLSALAETDIADEAWPEFAPALAYACEHPLCGYLSPSQGDLTRHFEFEHSIEHMREVEATRAACVEAQRLSRERDRVAVDRDRSFAPPWEREAVAAPDPPEAM